MNTRGIIGRKIVDVHQSRYWTNYGKVATAVDWLELDNGVRLMTSTAVGENDTWGNLIINTTGKKGKKNDD